MTYADRLGVPYAAFLGEDEIAQSKVSLKDMRSGEQSLLTIDEAVNAVLGTVKANGDAAPIQEPAGS